MLADLDERAAGVDVRLVGSDLQEAKQNVEGGLAGVRLHGELSSRAPPRYGVELDRFEDTLIMLQGARG